MPAVHISKKDEYRVIAVRGVSLYEEKTYDFDDALELTGNGRYNVALMLVLSLLLISMGMDMFGFPLVVTGCACDFQLTISQKGILTSMPFLGPVIMSYVWGYISDTQGRKKSLMIAMSLSFVFSVASSFSHNWITLAVLKLICTSFSSCAQSAAYTLLGESCSEKVRGRYMLIMSSFLHASGIFYYTLSYYILNLTFSYHVGSLGYYTPWRLLIQVMSLPLAIGSLLLLSFHESPKFLANAGRMSEALAVLKSIWTINGGKPDFYPVTKLASDDSKPKNIREIPLLKSIWDQTAPLFKPPLLLRTLQLLYITMVVYGSSNSFTVWFPFVANAFFGSLKTSTSSNNGICQLIKGLNGVEARGAEHIVAACSSRLEEFTFYSGLGLGSSFAVINLLISMLAAHKKTVTIFIKLLAALAAVGVVFSPEPVSAVLLYLIFTGTGLGIGLVSSYYVDLFPTSYRGMAACLGVMVARISGLAGVNLVGAFIVSYCDYTFLVGSAFILSGLVVACFLPSDRSLRKTTS